MQKRDTYHTKQKEKIVERIKEKEKEFTIKELYEELEEKVGLTTIYRLMDRLVEEGTIQKIIGKDNVVYYQYLESCSKENHFYLKCDYCGQMIHIDCDCITELLTHIQKNHQFSPGHEHIIIRGICKNCLHKEG